MRKNLRFKPTTALVFSNFDSWIRNSRTILMILFTLATSYLTVRSYGKGITALGYSMSFSESMAWLFMTGFNGIAMASLAFLVMISEIPRRIPFQQYSIIRTTRMKWIGAQILYCCLMVLTMLTVIFLLSAVFLIPYMTPGNGWSDTVRIAQGVDEDLALVPSWVRLNFTPWQAFAVSILPIFLFWFVMVLTVLLFSLLGAPAIGISIYGVILFSSIIFYFESIQGFEPPMTFSTLLKIGYQYEKELQSRFSSVLIGYAIIISALIFLILFIAKKMDMPVYALNKN